MAGNSFPATFYTKSLRTHPLFSMQKELSRLFEDFVGGDAGTEVSKSGGFSPRVDLIDTDKELKLTAEIPGIEEKDISLSVENGRLYLSGEKKKTSEEKEDGRHYVERVYGKFERVMTLPENIDEDSIEAVFKNGVLEVRIPKNAPVLPAAKKIEVKAAN